MSLQRFYNSFIYFFYRYTFTVFSNVFVYGITWAVLHITSDDLNNQIGPKDVYKFQHIVLIGMAVGIIASITFHSIIQETPHDSTGNKIKKKFFIYFINKI